MRRRHAKLLIAIEARAFELERPARTGIGNCLAGIVRALGEIDSVNRYRVVTVSPVDDEVKALVSAPNVSCRPLPLPQRVFESLRRRGRLPPFDLLVPRADVFLFTNFTTYPLRRTPFSVIIYDLSFVVEPDTLNDGYRERLLRTVPDAIARAASIIVPSEAVRAELVAHFATPPSKIVVATPGVDRRVFRPVSPADGAAVRSRLRMPDRYFLFVGTLQPRKNILGLLAAYRALPSDIRSREALVLVGMKGWRDDGIVAELDRLRAAGAHVHPIGYVATADLPAVYSGSTAFVWPSLYEGFGMPILEAMACGAPVITSDRSSMPEAAGGAALLVDPTDVNALSAAMLRIAGDDELARDLARRGLERAARADWHHTAARVLHALEMAAETAAPVQPGARTARNQERRRAS